MYSLFDDFMTAPFGYTTPRDRVYVIPESEYAKLQERQNAERVAQLEARKAEHLGVVEQLEKQIAELQPSLPEAEKEKELVAAKG
ncbi:MAG: guanylate-binding protein [Prochlorococcus sp.]|nr:guanylate-binding protein [Prochlorococcus sp.]CAI8168974.1 MAG: Uncharacterised protein [Prochlorococcus marinus str. MIT 9215]